MFSHNVYLQNNNLDVTFRDNIVDASVILSERKFEAVALSKTMSFLDNNAAVNFLVEITKMMDPLEIIRSSQTTWSHLAGYKNAD